MSENEAIRRFGEGLEKCLMESNGECRIFLENRGCACRNAVIFKLLKQYRAIGTPDECRAAVEKQRAKPVIRNTEDLKSFEIFICPTCKAVLQLRYKGSKNSAELLRKLCDECGQALLWE